jgi:ribA/ribD-fused uncharacterized protein
MYDDVPVIFRSGPLSNFFQCRLELPRPDGECRTYASVEHYFQASKALGRETHDRIADTPTPRDAKRAGRGAPLRADWELVKEQVMVAALRAKFTAEPLRSKLLATGRRPIIEESKHDLEWGARHDGARWHGRNRLGALLMRIRDELAAQTTAPSGEQLSLM